MFITKFKNSELTPFEKEMNRFFEGFRPFVSTDSDNENAVWSPSADIVEEKEKFLVKAELPGLNKEDIKLNIEDGKLSITGERKFENEVKDKNYHRIERSYGKFFRSFILPRNVDSEKISANFENGLLTVTIPKSEIAKAKEIPISVN